MFVLFSREKVNRCWFDQCKSRKAFNLELSLVNFGKIIGKLRTRDSISTETAAKTAAEKQMHSMTVKHLIRCGSLIYCYLMRQRIKTAKLRRIIHWQSSSMLHGALSLNEI